MHDIYLLNRRDFAPVDFLYERYAFRRFLCHKFSKVTAPVYLLQKKSHYIKDFSEIVASTPHNHRKQLCLRVGSIQ